MSRPVIAIVGRPNVGKSTLFNRLVGERAAITSDVAGTTRDRVYYETTLGTYDCILVDTAGMEFEKKKDLEADVQAQAKLAVEEAHLILFVMDGTQPLTKSDLDCAMFLRKSKKPILLVAHKCDNKESLVYGPEMHTLGLGDTIPVSSIHNMGIPELEAAIEKVFKKMKWKKDRKRSDKDETIQIAIVGKPNVGKSSLVNSILGEDRVLVSPMPGTTVDSIDTSVEFLKQKYVLIDTAGMRRRGKVRQGIEKYSVLRSLQAISRSDVTCLVLDGSDDIANQDLHVSAYILEAAKGLIIVVNKRDLFEDVDEEQKRFLRMMQYRMNFIPWAPVIFVSALKRKNIFQVLESAKHIQEERSRRIPDEKLKTFLETTIHSHPPTRSGKKIIFSRVFQSRTRPPIFSFFCNLPDLLHFSYRRFLENELRRKFGFHGTGIKLEFWRD